MALVFGGLCGTVTVSLWSAVPLLVRSWSGAVSWFSLTFRPLLNLGVEAGGEVKGPR